MTLYQALEDEEKEPTSASRFLPSVVLASTGTPAPGGTGGAPSTGTSTPSPLSVHSIKKAAHQLASSVTTYYNSLPPEQQQHLRALSSLL